MLLSCLSQFEFYVSCDSFIPISICFSCQCLSRKLLTTAITHKSLKYSISLCLLKEVKDEVKNEGRKPREEKQVFFPCFCCSSSSVVSFVTSNRRRKKKRETRMDVKIMMNIVQSNPKRHSSVSLYCLFLSYSSVCCPCLYSFLITYCVKSNQSNKKRRSKTGEDVNEEVCDENKITPASTEKVKPERKKERVVPSRHDSIMTQDIRRETDQNLRSDTIFKLNRKGKKKN